MNYSAHVRPGKETCHPVSQHVSFDSFNSIWMTRDFYGRFFHCRYPKNTFPVVLFIVHVCILLKQESQSKRVSSVYQAGNQKQISLIPPKKPHTTMRVRPVCAYALLFHSMHINPQMCSILRFGKPQGHTLSTTVITP